MPKLSVIVPIYNVDKYLSKCIESILAQTYVDLELILVNDGSQDNCAEIMESYALQDNRIVTIHQRNKGVSAARNSGLKIARGKYIGFIDPDDWVERIFFEKLIQILNDTNADIACCNWDLVSSDSRNRKHEMHNVSCIMSQKDFIRHIFDKPRSIGGSVWNKVFLKDKIKVYYDESIGIGEDYLFLMHYCKNISRACYLDKSLYHVYEREDSITRKESGKLVEGLYVTEKLIYMAEEIDGSLLKHAERDYLDSCYRLYSELIKQNDTENSSIAIYRFKTYLRKRLLLVLFNSEIYWKTKILYFIKLLS